MSIERPLLEILVCPIDKRGLLYFEDEAILYNPRLRRVYRLADDHLIMLAGQAEPVPAQEHARLIKRARHGDAAGTGGTAAGVLATEVTAEPGARPGTGGGPGSSPGEHGREYGRPDKDAGNGRPPRASSASLPGGRAPDRSLRSRVRRHVTPLLLVGIMRQICIIPPPQV